MVVVVEINAHERLDGQMRHILDEELGHDGETEGSAPAERRRKGRVQVAGRS